MTISTRPLVAPIIVLAFFLLFWTPAGAQSATPKPQLSQQVGLLADQPIVVTAQGLIPEQTYYVEQCFLPPDDAAPQSCRRLATQTADNTKSIAVEVVPEVTYAGVTVVNCADASCGIRLTASNLSPPSEPTSFTFDPAVKGKFRPRGIGRLEIESTDKPLVDQELVVLSHGTNHLDIYKPSILQCVSRDGQIGGRWCVSLQITTESYDPSISHPTQVRPKRYLTFLRDGSLTHVDCASAANVCVLAVYERGRFSGRLAAMTNPLEFDDSVSNRTRVRVSQRRDLMVGQQITIRTNNHYAEAISVYQCGRRNQSISGCDQIAEKRTDPERTHARITITLDRFVGEIGSVTDCAAARAACSW